MSFLPPHNPDASNDRRRRIIWGIGVILLVGMVWMSVEQQLDRWAVGVMIVVIGGLLGASFYNGMLSSQRDRREGEIDNEAMPSADILLANIPDPIILIDRRMMVFEINAAATDLFPTLKKGLPLSLSLRSPDVLGGIDQVLRFGSAIKIQHIERLPTERAFELQISPLQEGTHWVILFFRDLTSARRLEKMRVDFIANVSHELRTPLSSVIGFIETIQGPARQDAVAQQKFLAVMLAQSQRMARLIDDLLSLSRIELHGHVMPDTPLDMESIVHQIIPTLSPLAEEHGLTIALSIEEGPFVINGDRDEMLRVAENLVENAIKYGGKGGKIDVILRRLQGEEGQNSQISLTIRDYGDGIAPEHLPRLTERFYRIDTDISRRKGGTGLGLAIVKHIVIRHRGRLTIDSELGRGSSFTVTLPCRPDDSARNEKA